MEISPGLPPREAGKQVTGINIIKEESPWIRIWLPGRKPGSWGSRRRKRKGPSHLLPGKAGCHCPGGQPGLSVQCRRAGPHGLGGNGVWHPPGQGNQKSLCGPAGLGRPSGTSGPWAFSGRTRRKKVWDVGVPVGVIAAIVPSTNPTSTVCYKAMIALKAGCSIVFSPPGGSQMHPAGRGDCGRAAEGPAAPGAQWVACKLPPWRL